MSVETQTESSAVDCDPDSTFSISFASCVSDAKISTLAITNGESSTVFYKVEYSLDSGTTFTVLSANLSVAASTSDSSSTTSVSEGGTIIWRITDSFTTGDFTNMSLEAQAESEEIDCSTPDPTTTTTTTTITTTTNNHYHTTTTTTTTTLPVTIAVVEREVPKNKFLPIIYNERFCKENGGANYGLSVNNVNSNVAAELTVRVFVDNKRVAESKYIISAGEFKSITTISNVPEDSKYKTRFIITDSLGSNKSVGKFKKNTNCCSVGTILRNQKI